MRSLERRRYRGGYQEIGWKIRDSETPNAIEKPDMKKPALKNALLLFSLSHTT